MIIYDCVKSRFLEDVLNQSIAEQLEKTIEKRLHRKSGKAEIASWQNSLQFMANVLSEPSIPENAGVAIEYNIPETAKRVDFIISGYDAEEKPSAVIIELKQWSSLNAVPGTEALVETYTGGALRKTVHPSYQAWSYASLIRDYNQTVQEEEITLKPCAWLHNYERSSSHDPLDEPQYQTYEEEAPAFDKKEARDLQKYIRSSIAKGDDSDVMYRIDHGKLRPSRRLQDAIAGMVAGRKEFVLIDDQKVAFDTIARISEQCQKDGKKRTVIVKGGPGTGKTVVAVNLLAALTQKGQLVGYVTRNSAPRKVYLQVLKGKGQKSSVDNLFLSSDRFYQAEENLMDTILADEAHRLREKSGIYGNLGINQIMELIRASKCSVFFLDEEQRVTMQDIGSADEIRRWASALHSEVTQLTLSSQFRCNGSDGYLAWLDHTLEIRDTAVIDLDGIDYDFEVFDTPEEMRDRIFEKNRISNRARITAGYCWDWPKKERNDPDYKDIKIGSFEMSWNFENGIWATDPESVNECGCIHTCQGLEFDYIGVIIGDDMRYEDGRVITDFRKRSKDDMSIRGMKTLAKKDPERAEKLSDEIIKNTYRTLMTRGMKGCYVYCTDDALRDHLRECMHQEDGWKQE